jgi:hypothetical protein
MPRSCKRSWEGRFSLSLQPCRRTSSHRRNGIFRHLTGWCGTLGSSTQLDRLDSRLGVLFGMVRSRIIGLLLLRSSGELGAGGLEVFWLRILLWIIIPKDYNLQAFINSAINTYPFTINFAGLLSTIFSVPLLSTMYLLADLLSMILLSSPHNYASSDLPTSTIKQELVFNIRQLQVSVWTLF